MDRELFEETALPVAVGVLVTVAAFGLSIIV
jgi:hypothetical protein